MGRGGQGPGQGWAGARPVLMKLVHFTHTH